MALQGSGEITLADIQAEFGGSAPIQLSEYYGKGNAPASGQIRLANDFYGTSNIFSFTITTNQTNASLYTLAVNAGWDQSSPIVATINSGVYISSNSTGTPALTVSSIPSGSTLINNGTIVGMGGNGGYGFIPRFQGHNIGANSNGASAGGALLVSSAINVTNNGTIAGGGGGGGGGGGRVGYVNNYFYVGGGSGGGGRSSASANSSAGGLNSGQNNPKYFGNVGGAGTVNSAGGGGNRGAYGNYRGANGGAGGNWGASGSSGQAYNYSGGSGSGGGGGYAVSGNSNITWNATGTRLGAIA